MNDFEILSHMNSTRDFFPFISYINFPHFKNMEDGSQINFCYPITAIVGSNGTNKSSILRALQSSPEGNNISDYWFETSLDPIDRKNPQRYFYGYQLPSGTTAEVIQTRVFRTDRSDDYFETRAPRPSDHMNRMPQGESAKPSDSQFRNATRWKSIKKEVVYLDFRAELPAYDIYFNFNWRGQQNDATTKKKYLRKTSPLVSKVFEEHDKSYIWYQKNRILEPAIDLPDAQVDAISTILGRSYSKISLVKHEFFRVEGYTAQLSTASRQYSEAYAGSGEFAAIMLVHKLSEASDKSLILLDEPETSLHPQAQRELMRYVAKQCIIKKHQVILSTHAPSIIEELPEQAIKILDVREDDFHVDVLSQSASPAEAFNRLGAKYSKRTILVEDDLAAELIKRAARLIGSDYYESISIEPVPGGSGSIKTRVIPALAATNAECFVILDGDMRPLHANACDDGSPLRNSSDVSDNELENELGKLSIKKKHLLCNGGNDDPEKLTEDAMRRALEWINDHVRFLPSHCNPDYLLLKICKGVLPKETLPSCSSSDVAKKTWDRIANEECGLADEDSASAKQIFYTQQRWLTKVLKEDSSIPEMVEIQTTLKTLLPSL